MDRWVGKVAIVTGASAGIGADIAVRLVDAGLKVAALARRVERVEELAQKLSHKKGKIYPVKADITKEEDILQAFKWIKDNLGPVSVLINNAGILSYSSLTDGDSEDWRKIFDTNVLGLCIATREAVKDMRANNIDGHIIHINALTGHTVINIPGFNVYPASKFAVTALTETLRNELNSLQLKIKISSISPGYVRTEIGVGKFPDELVKHLVTLPALTTEDVSDAIIYALSTPPHVQVHELIVAP